MSSAITGASSSEDPTCGLPSTTRRRLHLALAATWALAALFYLWSGTSGGAPLSLGGTQTDYYNLLTDAFLKGHLSLLIPVPKQFLVLKNPYNPALNSGFSSEFHDLSYYHGHFFLSWGPTPVLTLFAPWRLLHIGGMPENLAVWIYSTVGLGFTLATLALLLKRYLPQFRLWIAVVAAFALSFSNIAAFLLRRPLWYEVAVSCTYCFTMIGIYLLCSALARPRPSTIRLALGSLSIGLAMGGQIDGVLIGALLIFAAIYLIKSLGLRQSMRNLTALLLPFVLVLLLLLAYNEARFGSILQFGSGYQLAGFDPRTQPDFQLSFLAPNLFYYYLAPARFTLAFPYFVLSPPPTYPGVIPAHYIGIDSVIGGIITTAPVIIGLLFLPVRRKLGLPPYLAWCCGAFLSTGMLVALTVSFAVGGASERYEAPFISLLILPATIVWIALSANPRRLVRRPAKVLYSLFVLYGSLVGIAVSTTGYYGELQTASPKEFDALQSASSFFPTTVDMLIGHPEITRVVSPNSVASLVDAGTLNAGGDLTFFLSKSPDEIDVIAPHDGMWTLDWNWSLTSPTINPLDLLSYDVANGTYHRAFRFGASFAVTPILLQRGLNRISVRLSDVQPGMAQAATLIAVSGVSIDPESK